MRMNESEWMLEKQTQYYLPSDSGWCRGAGRGHYESSEMTYSTPASERCGKILMPPSVYLGAERVSEEDVADAAYIER